MHDTQNPIGTRSALQGGKGLRYKLSPQDLSSVAGDNLEDSNSAGSAFVVEFKDKLYAYENRCPHLGVELDWEPGKFFDDAQQYLICSTHGALFEPDTGHCISGPCSGQSLTPVSVVEHAGSLFRR